MRRLAVILGLSLLALPCRADSVLLSESFDTLPDGPFNGTNGWTTAPADAALIQGTVTRAASAKACSLTRALAGPLADLSWAAPAALTNVVWRDWYARPVFSTVVTCPSNRNATVFFTVQAPSGTLMVYDGPTARLLTTAPRANAGAWTRFTVKADYARRRWSLWLNATNVATDLLFFNTNATSCTALHVSEASPVGATNYLDDVRVWSASPSSPMGWTVPFSENFESANWGPLDAQRGWQVLQGTSVDVQSQTVQAGLNACRIGGTGTQQLSRLVHAFDASTPSPAKVRTAWYARPAFNSRPLQVIDPRTTTLFYAQQGTGALVVYDGKTPVTLTNKPALSTDTWAYFEVEADYTQHRWSLSVNSTLMASGLAFYNTNIAAYARFGIDEGSASGSHLDSLRIGFRTGFAMNVK